MYHDYYHITLCTIDNNGKKEKRTKLGSLFRMSLFGKANPPSHPQLPSSPPPLNASPVKLKSTSGPTPIVTKISNNNDDDDDDVDVHRTLRNDSQSNSHNTSSTTYLNSINYHRSSKKDRSMNFDRSVNSSVNSREALSSTTRTATTTTYPSSTASSDATSTATIKKGSSSSSSSRGTSLFKKTAAAGLQYFNRPTKSKATEEEGGGGLEEDFDRHLTVVQQLRDMGYSEKEVVIALNASGHNLEAALTMLNEDRGTALDRTDGVVP